MLSTVGRRVRLALTALVAVLAVSGTLYGQDDHFPFAPFRMFATRTAPDGPVRVVELRGRTAGAAAEGTLSMASFGLRRAELEGQLGRLRSPGMLGELVRAREALRDELPRVDVLRLVEVEYLLDDGRQVGRRETTVAEWRR
ncbi:MAG TPA: hypothetical protein VEZ46_13810 [Mycobacteriales bacterium]|jgi:hypothetical protein|nr:hypothetical protein [Mycobacteriales bacterium]